MCGLWPLGVESGLWDVENEQLEADSKDWEVDGLTWKVLMKIVSGG